MRAGTLPPCYGLWIASLPSGQHLMRGKLLLEELVAEFVCSGHGHGWIGNEQTGTTGQVKQIISG
jgi:hypothetical protein